MAEPPVPEVPHPPAGTDPSPTERVSDADRDRIVTLLREHMAEGRLTLDEFSDRVAGAIEAVTRADLAACLTDLPGTAPLPVARPQAAAAPQKRRWHVAVLSEHSTKGRWRIGGKTNAVAVLGGCDMDLRRAEIAGPEVFMTAFALLGQVTIVVPEGFEVELQGFTFLGGRDLRLRDVARVPGSPVIVVRAFSVLGGIEVKSRPARAARRLGRGARTARASSGPGPGADGPPPTDLAAAGSAVTADGTVAADGTVTILFCDLVDAAGMTERLGEQASLRILQENQRMVRQAVARHGGREVSGRDDGFMVAFGGAARALRCAIDVQRALHAYVPPPGAERISVHIGVHSGDAVDREGDSLGHTVIVASRLADAAGPSEILVSSLTEQLVQGSDEFSFDGHAERPLTGLMRAQPAARLSWSS